MSCAAAGCTATRTTSVEVSMRLPELEHTEEGAYRTMTIDLCARHAKVVRWQPRPGDVSPSPSAREVAEETKRRLRGGR